MKRIIYILHTLLAAVTTTYAQEIGTTIDTDTMGISTVVMEVLDTNNGILNPSSTNRALPYNVSGLPALNTLPELKVSPYLFHTNPLPSFLRNISGYTAQQSLPGLMGIESGAISYNLNMGPITFTPSVYANRYGYFGGVTTSYGLGGQLDLQLNEKFSLTLFGSHYTNAWTANPAVMSNMMSSRFGGYATWNINDTWGLNVGAQRVYNCATNRWQTIPIVMPTLRINGKDAIGIDVGGLLYQIMESKNNWGPRNPTMGPPVHPTVVIPPRD